MDLSSLLLAKRPRTWTANMSSLVRLSAANRLVRTFVACLPTWPYLNCHLIVRAIENQPTTSGDAPLQPCVIAASGELDPSDSSLSEVPVNTDSDPYEDWPDDQDPLADGNVQEKPEVALRVAREIREVGNKLFKQGNTSEALSKYQST